MKRIILPLMLCCIGVSLLSAQNNYLVHTSSTQQAWTSEEEEFVSKHFPLVPLCKWQAGMRFMFIPSAKDMFMPTLFKYETEKGVLNRVLKHKVLTFVGTEEKAHTMNNETIHSTRFIFEAEEGEKFFYEFRNLPLEEICIKMPRACINGLVYLDDVDKAKQLLLGKTIYIQAEMVRIDSPNSFSGYQEVRIEPNTQGIVTAIGVGSQAYPVKIVFRDTQGRSFYLEMAFSRTNSGMDKVDFQGEKKMKFFPNGVSFTNKDAKGEQGLRSKYIGAIVYPKKNLPSRRQVELENLQTKSRVHIPRYTVLTIKDIRTTPSSSLATFVLTDKRGETYEVEADTKYDVIVRNNNYIEDIFGFEDIQQKYPTITENRWKLISQGKVEAGMSTDECRLSLGEPIEMELRTDNRFEVWFYNGRTLEFESGTLRNFR